MKLKYIPPKKLKVLTGMFFGSGSLGIIMGISQVEFMMTVFGTGLLCIGGLTGWMLLTQEPKLRDKRKKKRDDD
jgi:hypothetical protein